MTRGPLRLSVLQQAAVFGDPAENARRIAAAARDTAADLLLTHELSLTGYDLRDRTAELAVSLEPAPDPVLAPLREAGDVVVGLPERDAQGRVYNAAAHLRDGHLLHRHRKLYLPTYGMFDEARYFARGDRARCYDAAPGWRVGLLVCEDFWHPSVAYLLALQGADLLLVLSAAPGRGVWEGGEAGGRFASADVWERIARTTAQTYGVYLALCNRVGVEGPVTFAGGSLIVGPDGAVLARAPADGEARLDAELDPSALAAARRPYAHLRDEDPALVLRELERILGASAIEPTP